MGPTRDGLVEGSRLRKTAWASLGAQAFLHLVSIETQMLQSGIQPATSCSAAEHRYHQATIVGKIIIYA